MRKKKELTSAEVSILHKYVAEASYISKNPIILGQEAITSAQSKSVQELLSFITLVGRNYFSEVYKPLDNIFSILDKSDLSVPYIREVNKLHNGLRARYNEDFLKYVDNLVLDNQETYTLLTGEVIPRIDDNRQIWLDMPTEPKNEIIKQVLDNIPRHIEISLKLASLIQSFWELNLVTRPSDYNINGTLETWNMTHDSRKYQVDLINIHINLHYPSSIAIMDREGYSIDIFGEDGSHVYTNDAYIIDGYFTEKTINKIIERLEAIKKHIKEN